jgi:hypothetical protein
MRRLGISTAERQRAERPGQIWSWDFVAGLVAKDLDLGRLSSNPRLLEEGPRFIQSAIIPAQNRPSKRCKKLARKRAAPQRNECKNLWQNLKPCQRHAFHSQRETGVATVISMVLRSGSSSAASAARWKRVRINLSESCVTLH